MSEVKKKERSIAEVASVEREAGTLTFHTIMRNLILGDRSINLEKVIDMAPCARPITHQFLNLEKTGRERGRERESSMHMEKQQRKTTNSEK